MKKLSILILAVLFSFAVNLGDASAGKVTPSHVYQTAANIVGDLNKIRVAGGGTAVAMKSGASGKSPGDVYDAGARLVGVLGGSAGAKPGGKITPVNVMDILNKAHGLVKTKGATNTAFVDGKSPSDVYDAVETAIAAAK